MFVVKKAIKIACFIVVLFSISIKSSEKVEAFQPAAHYSLIQNVAEELPSDSIIENAIKTYPNIAAWGAVGPDLGYFQPSQLGGYAPWADKYHYYKVGTFAKNMLEKAISANDLREIAFAAGWVSHISGDLACHGIYVNPECGVYMDNEETRDLHSELEKKAEPYVWKSLGGQSVNIYTNKKLANLYCETESIPLDLLNDVSESVYGTSASTFEEKRWCDLLLAGLNSGVGYSYTNYDDAISFLSKNGRRKRLEKAYITAKKQCIELLKLADKNDYSKFSDRWNLDVGASESPISSLTAIVSTGTKSGAGTDDDIYFGVELRTGESKEWKLDKSFYNDFENGDNDEYYLYINDIDFSPSLVSKVWIQKKHIKYSVGEAWYLNKFKVDVNGKVATSEVYNGWVKGNNTIYFDVDWSDVTNTSDPTF